jgi:hypothetical protein
MNRKHKIIITIMGTILSRKNNYDRSMGMTEKHQKYIDAVITGDIDDIKTTMSHEMAHQISIADMEIIRKYLRSRFRL